MGTPYEVTYRNMWPSDAINARVRDNFGALRERCTAALACQTFIELEPGMDLVSLRILVGGRDARRTLNAKPEQDEVCAEIDAAFIELSSRLGAGQHARAA